MDMINIMKAAALGAVEAGNPVNICFGTVTAAKPLQIIAEQKIPLGSVQLILTRNVTEYTVEMTVDHMTEEALEELDFSHTHSYSGETETGGEPAHSHSYAGETDSALGKIAAHAHGYKGRKTFTVHNGLKVGEKVLLIRLQGGQKYLVLDRIGREDEGL